MNEQLLLGNIRNVLVRLEETIIFALLERAQFRRNQNIYRPGAYPTATGNESIMGFLLHETERIHAAMRRYTSPDEHPFFHDLPEPALPVLRFDENPLAANTVNINDKLRSVYEQEIIPLLCAAGDDLQYGSSSVCDVACLQALSKRIHYGKFVAESKFQSEPAVFAKALAAGDAKQLKALITDRIVEAKVQARVRRKTMAYSRELSNNDPAAAGHVSAESMEHIYREWIIPMTKDVEVVYLLQTKANS